MLDKFDYEEPRCPLTGGKEFYNPKPDTPKGRIPVSRIIEKVNSLFDKNDYAEAGRLLEYWEKEAIELNDKQGELSILSELAGFYRKQNDSVKGLSAIDRALGLLEELKLENSVSGATVLLNCATALKAFGNAEKALPLYKKCEQIYKGALKSDDARFGGLYNNMALCLGDLKRFDEAESYYFSALEVMERAAFGQNECAITYINLAHLYEAEGKSEKIKECMDLAYALLKDKSLPHNGYYAFVCEKCAPSFGYFGFKDICDELLGKAREIYEGT